jgi:hypothetical protein
LPNRSTGATIPAVQMKEAVMFYLGATDQRVTLVDDGGHEVYSTDFKNFPNVLTHLRSMIRAIALTNPAGEVDKNLLKVFENQFKKEKNFHSITAIPFGVNLDSKFLALVALTTATTTKPKKK